MIELTVSSPASFDALAEGGRPFMVVEDEAQVARGVRPGDHVCIRDASGRAAGRCAFATVTHVDHVRGVTVVGVSVKISAPGMTAVRP